MPLGYKYRTLAYDAVSFYIRRQNWKSRGVLWTVSSNTLFHSGISNKESLKPVEWLHGGSGLSSASVPWWLHTPGLGPQEKLYFHVGNWSPAKFPDVSQRPALQADLSKDLSLRTARVPLLCTDWFYFSLFRTVLCWSSCVCLGSLRLGFLLDKLHRNLHVVLCVCM